MTVSRIGAWVGRAGVLPGWERSLAVARAVGLTDVSLVAHGQDAGKPFDPFVAPSKLRAVADAYTAAGIRPHAMFYPQADAKHAEYLLKYLAAAAPSIASAELDAEEQWTHGPHEKHGAAVARQLQAGWPKGCPIVVNGITAALGKIGDLVGIAETAIPQAYTSTKPGQNGTPGKRQSTVAALWRKAAPGARMVLGLAAYEQQGAGGLSAAEAMCRAFDAAQDAGVDEVRYWSLADLDGPARAFVAARCAELHR